MSLTVGVGQVGTGIGGALAGSLYATAGYGASALLAGVAMAVITVLIYLFLPAVPVDSGSGPDPDPDSGPRTGPPGEPSAAERLACDALCGPTAEGGYTDEG
jgi:hypothetical protein